MIYVDISGIYPIVLPRHPNLAGLAPARARTSFVLAYDDAQHYLRAISLSGSVQSVCTRISPTVFLLQHVSEKYIPCYNEVIKHPGVSRMYPKNSKYLTWSGLKAYSEIKKIVSLSVKVLR